MTNNIRNRLERLERAVGRQIKPDELAAQTHVEQMMPELIAFIDAAIPGRRESVAHHVMQIFGLPDSRACQNYLQGRSLETIARDTYGENWQAEMKATTAKAAVQFEAAHGSNWRDKFTVIWLGAEKILALLGRTAPGTAGGQGTRSKPAKRSTP